MVQARFSMSESDPRWFQIAFLSGLFVFGVALRDFTFSWSATVLVIASALSVQLALVWRAGLPWSSLRSATISALSTLLLCRGSSPWLVALAAALAIASKGVFRYKGKHFFNPTNFGIVAVLLVTREVWVSPAQWGEETLVVAWILLLGITVARRSRRDDVSLAFLAAYSALLLARVTYLGQPLAVLGHQLRNGGLMLFTFFMISDPRSTPDHPWGRALFAALVALLAYVLRFWLYQPAAIFLALFFLSPLTLIIDTLFKHPRFTWEAPHAPARSVVASVAPRPSPQPI